MIETKMNSKFYDTLKELTPTGHFCLYKVDLLDNSYELVCKIAVQFLHDELNEWFAAGDIREFIQERLIKGWYAIVYKSGISCEISIQHIDEQT